MSVKDRMPRWLGLPAGMAGIVDGALHIHVSNNARAASRARKHPTARRRMAEDCMLTWNTCTRIYLTASPTVAIISTH